MTSMTNKDSFSRGLQVWLVLLINFLHTRTLKDTQLVMLDLLTKFKLI